MRYQIINIRGTNGAGKTTAVRAIMNHLVYLKDYTTKNGVFTHIYATPEGDPVAFIGKYDAAATGGVDRIKNVRDVVAASAEICPHAHIVMEGLLMSGLQQLTKDVADACAQHADFHAFTIDTPLQKCIDQTLARRAAVGNVKPFDPEKSLKPKYRAVELAHAKMTSWGMDSRVLSQRDIVCNALTYLRAPFDPNNLGI
jgi:adenylylsulfate kinase-like enzyme